MKRRFYYAILNLALAFALPAWAQSAAPDAPASLATPPADLNQADAFRQFLAQVRADAQATGISARTIDAALAGVQPIARVLELDRAQPEFRLTFDEYIRRVISDARINEGRKLLREHRPLLDSISLQYGVPARYIVALWGAETSYGRVTGNFRIVNALTTLAFDGRRSSYFRGELMNALRILEEGHITPDAMLGSWAGAMGQPQFMPSSFLRFAVDHDGDGRRDIWRTRADVFASTANYLSQSGWRRDELWGRAVQLPVGFDAAMADLKVTKTVDEWSAMGLRQLDGSPLPSSSLPASVILPGGAIGPAYIVYENFRTIMKWNRSIFYATAIGTLADRIGDG